MDIKKSNYKGFELVKIKDFSGMTWVCVWLNGQKVLGENRDIKTMAQAKKMIAEVFAK